MLRPDAEQLLSTAYDRCSCMLGQMAESACCSIVHCGSSVWLYRAFGSMEWSVKQAGEPAFGSNSVSKQHRKGVPLLVTFFVSSCFA